MYLVAIAWLYVVVLMSLAEAFSDRGSWLGAVVTFILYGAVPLAVALYLIGTPARRAARLRASAPTGSEAPDGGDHPAADPLAPERKEP